MRNKHILIGIVLALITAPAMAGQGASKEESVGVGAGAAVGAILGGPVGFVVGKLTVWLEGPVSKWTSRRKQSGPQVTWTHCSC